MAQSYAVLTNGTSAASFADGAGGHTWYKIESNWIPRVANKRKSQLGGRGPYEDVDETIPISIGGSNAAHMYSNISTLKAILDQADDWYQGAAVSACSFLYSPTHATISSAASPLQAAVWNTGLELSEDFDVQNSASGARTWMMGARMQFRRRGLWANIAASGSASGNNGGVVTVSVGSSSPFLSPTNVTFTNYYQSVDEPAAFFAIGNTSTAIQAIDVGGAAGFPSGDSRWTYASGSANRAIGDYIMRFNPSSTDEGGGQGVVCVTTKNKAYDVFALLRNNSSTLSYRFRTGFFYTSSASPTFYTPVQVIQPHSGTAYAGYYHVGVVVSPNSGSPTIWFYATPSASAGSGNWLDCDQVVLVERSNGNVIKIKNNSAAGASSAVTQNIGYVSNLSLEITESTNGLALEYFGTGNYTSAASVYALLMTVEGTNWRQYSGGVRSNTWTITRTNAYPVPV